MGKKRPSNTTKSKNDERLEFTQDFIPVKDIRHGIIETTDHRYIKILEIEPINFMLRSDEEQFGSLCMSMARRSMTAISSAPPMWRRCAIAARLPALPRLQSGRLRSRRPNANDEIPAVGGASPRRPFSRR